MTQRQRAAIIRYWLSKTWFDLGPASMRRLARRHFFFITALSLAFSGTAFSAESPLVKALEAGSKPKEAVSVKKPAAAQSKAVQKNDKEKRVMKTVKGALMFLTKNRMAVEFVSGEAGAEDLLLKVHEQAVLKRAKKFSDIKPGDQVEAKYVETYLEPEKAGEEPKVLSRVATEITFVSKAPVLPKGPENALVEGL